MTPITSLQSQINKAKKDLVLTTRTITVEWYIPESVQSGQYRILHRGTSYDDPVIGKAKFTPYQGVSRVFQI